MTEIVDVVWVSYHSPEIIARGYWDQGLLERVMCGLTWRAPSGVEFAHSEAFDSSAFRQLQGRSAVVVVPAQHHASLDDVRRLSHDLSGLSACLVILTGDECSLFPLDQLVHHDIHVWVMTPRPARHAHLPVRRFIGEGYRFDVPELIEGVSPLPPEKDEAWFFAGQVTHRRRQECERAMKQARVPGMWVGTPGFTQGLSHIDYVRGLVRAKVVPCPSGPGTPDSFRMYEAMEAGAVPLVDAVTPEGWRGFWDLMFDGERQFPFPVIEDWRRDGPPALDLALGTWPLMSNRACSWWMREKRQLTLDLHDEAARWAGRSWGSDEPADAITVLMPTSPIPSHPSTHVIEQTIQSLVDAGLQGAEVHVLIDGVRSEQLHRWSDYQEYVRRLIWLCQHQFHNVLPVFYEQHLHQAEMTRRALDDVRTPTVLFVEHDTPLTEEPIPWRDLVAFIRSGDANLVRFHHEAQVLDVHQHLMPDRHVDSKWPVPVLRCMQWSQRPHLASTGFYRRVIERYFGKNARTMIEDTMHGVLDHHWREEGDAGWEQFRTFMYAPPGNIKRSTHLDGRESDPKYSMTFDYNDGPAPPGAPHPGTR